MNEYKDCLACGASFSEQASNDSECDKLYCIVKDKYVKEDDICEEFNGLN